MLFLSVLHLALCSLVALKLFGKSANCEVFHKARSQTVRPFPTDVISVFLPVPRASLPTSGVTRTSVIYLLAIVLSPQTRHAHDAKPLTPTYTTRTSFCDPVTTCLSQTLEILIIVLFLKNASIYEHGTLKCTVTCP
jgi:hypothetical protein